MNTSTNAHAPSPSFAPTADTLWAVWGTSPDDQVASGWSEPIYQIWVLASTGAEGIAQIQKSMSGQLLAAAMLTEVVQAYELSQLAAGKGVESLMPAWLKPIRDPTVLLCRNPDQTFSWIFGGTASPGQEVLTEGKLSDLADLAQEGQTILRDRLYQKITSDRRPVEPGHPLGWLLMMSNPDAWQVEYPALPFLPGVHP
jgi:hypothetical protein